MCGCGWYTRTVSDLKERGNMSIHVHNCLRLTLWKWEGKGGSKIRKAGHTFNEGNHMMSWLSRHCAENKYTFPHAVRICPVPGNLQWVWSVSQKWLCDYSWFERCYSSLNLDLMNHRRKNPHPEVWWLRGMCAVNPKYLPITLFSEGGR